MKLKSLVKSMVNSQLIVIKDMNDETLKITYADTFNLFVKCKHTTDNLSKELGNREVITLFADSNGTINITVK